MPKPGRRLLQHRRARLCLLALGHLSAEDDIFARLKAALHQPLDAPREVRMREAEQAQSWYKAITVETFG